jgi:hypothetical protein
MNLYHDQQRNKLLKLQWPLFCDFYVLFSFFIQDGFKIKASNESFSKSIEQGQQTATAVLTLRK